MLFRILLDYSICDHLLKGLPLCRPFTDINALLSPILEIYILLSNIIETNAQVPEQSDNSKEVPHFSLKNTSSIFSNVSIKDNFISNGKFLFSMR